MHPENRRLSFALGWLRVVIAVLGFGSMAIWAPAVRDVAWIVVVYVCVALCVQFLIHRGIGGITRSIAFSVIDVGMITFVIHRMGLLSPMLVGGFCIVLLFYPFALGMRGGVIVAVAANAFFLGFLWAESLGYLPYAPDVSEWGRGGGAASIKNATTISMMFPTLTFSGVLLVGKLVENLKAQRAINEELLARLQIGEYRLERLLGQGGMGQVWEAVHRASGERVALKFLRMGLHDSDALHHRFMREARIVLSLDHPNIVRIREVIEVQGSPVIAMDLLRGESLAHLLLRRSPLELDEAARILLPVVSAVGAAHAQGVVHRDLKPDNIFLDEVEGGDVVPKVLDFGIAKLTHREASGETMALTSTGIVMGTPWYMAPEQAFGEAHVDHRLDVWSLGVIFYECLAGRRPFAGDSPGQVFRALLSGEMAPLGSVRPDLPAEISDLVARMLVRSRDARLGDMREVHAVLLRYARGPAPSFGPPSSRSGGALDGTAIDPSHPDGSDSSADTRELVRPARSAGG
jgi:serine/threonine protein kinase